MPPIVQKRLLGKEDCDFDFNGTNETRTTTDGSGNSIEVTKLNDSHIPTLADLRVKVGGANNINSSLDYLADGLNDIGSATLEKEGLIEIATEAEALALTDPNKAITPAALGALNPSETQRGLPSKATLAESAGRTLLNKYLAPANIASLSEAQTGVAGAVIDAERLQETMHGGVSQSWQDVTGSRSLGVTYENTTNLPIKVYFRSSSATIGSRGQITTDGLIFDSTSSTEGNSEITKLIRPGQDYQLNIVGTIPTIISVYELR